MQGSKPCLLGCTCLKHDPSSKLKPLCPEEVPEQLRNVFAFESQHLKARSGVNNLYIYQTCLGCGQQTEAQVSSIRSSLKRGRPSGKCHPCSLPRGPNHPNWNGGRRLREGYMYILTPGHPYATKNGLVFEHRLVMEKILDRYLTPDETVHHLNGIKTDNRPENLELWVGAGSQPKGIRAEDVPHCPSCRCNVARI